MGDALILISPVLGAAGGLVVAVWVTLLAIKVHRLDDRLKRIESNK